MNPVAVAVEGNRVGAHRGQQRAVQRLPQRHHGRTAKRTRRQLDALQDGAVGAAGLGSPRLRALAI